MNSDKRLTRREWMARGAGAVVAAGAAAAGAYLLYDPKGDAGLWKPSDTAVHLKDFFAGVDFPASNPRISVATGSMEHVGRMVRAAIGGLAPASGMKRFIAKGDVVLLKPNVGFDRSPDMGATTHPSLAACLA